MRKLTILIAGGIGYVLGAKAGRTRYEQIRRSAQRVADNPQVQKAAKHAQETDRRRRLEGGPASPVPSDDGLTGNHGAGAPPSPAPSLR